METLSWGELLAIWDLDLAVQLDLDQAQQVPQAQQQVPQAQQQVPQAQQVPHA
jgi:hypothetical protein